MTEDAASLIAEQESESEVEQPFAPVDGSMPGGMLTNDSDNTTPPGPVAQSLADVAEPEPAPELVAEPEPESPLLSLLLRFSDECWVEISDSRKRLLYGMEKAGAERRLEGRPPFRLFLGNTDAVELYVAEQKYVVPGSARTGTNTARFVIDDEVISEVLGR
jgi:cytoskeleton protein RodZ